MTIKKKGNLYYLYSAFFLVILILAMGFGNVEFPNSINTYCEVFPVTKWVVCKGTNGQITSSVVDYFSGLNTNYNISQFQRGETMSFCFDTKLLKNRFIKKGDTIGATCSSYLNEKIISLNGELKLAEAELEENKAGEKTPLVEEYEKRIKLSKLQLEQEKINFDRIEKLHEKGFVSEEEFLNEKAKIFQLQTEIEINQSILDSRKSGAKPQTINYLEEKIKSHKNNIAQLETHKNNLLITSPISGEVIRSFAPDTLLTVINNEQVVLKFPIKLNFLNQINEGDELKIIINNANKEYYGTILSISKEVKVLHYEQVVFAAVLVKNDDLFLIPGMVCESSMEISKINLFGLIKNYITN